VDVICSRDIHKAEQGLDEDVSKTLEAGKPADDSIQVR